MKILSEKELTKELAMSRWTVRRMRLQEGMPYFTVGKSILYDLENVYKWIESKQIQVTESYPSVENKPSSEKQLQYGQLRKIV